MTETHTTSWKPIEDLPADWERFASKELESLATSWNQMLQEMRDAKTLQTFHERLCREWAIETGILERLYTIDRGTTQLLIEQGIDSILITHGATNRPVDEVIAIIQDQREALEGLFAYVSQQLEGLSVHYIRSLHQVLVRSQAYTEAIDQFCKMGRAPLVKGSWKTQSNNPLRPDGSIHTYCPPEHVQSEMERLIDMHNQHTEQHVAPVVEAAWLHHRFTQIHPFQDGNGRVARALATLVFIRGGYVPLVINRDDRAAYIAALEQADAGDLQPLVKLFYTIQKRAYLNGLSIRTPVLHVVDPLETLIDKIAVKYQERLATRTDYVFQIAHIFQHLAYETMHYYADRMKQQFNQREIPVTIGVQQNNERTAMWYTSSIVATAKQLGFFADIASPQLWVRLSIHDRTDIASDREIVVSLHYLGSKMSGIMNAVAFLNSTPIALESTQEGVVKQARSWSTHVIVTESFTFTHNDDPEDTQRHADFKEWLTQALAVGLATWQRQL